MPRQPRYNLSGFPQHVIQRGNNRQAVFFDDHGFILFWFQCLRHSPLFHRNNGNYIQYPLFSSGAEQAGSMRLSEY